MVPFLIIPFSKFSFRQEMQCLHYVVLVVLCTISIVFLYAALNNDEQEIVHQDKDTIISTITNLGRELKKEGCELARKINDENFSRIINGIDNSLQIKDENNNLDSENLKNLRDLTVELNELLSEMIKKNTKYSQKLEKLKNIAVNLIDNITMLMQQGNY